MSDRLVVRLRREGGACVMHIPQRVRDELCFKVGDMLVVSAQDGALVARKVDLARALADVTPARDDGGGGGEG